MSRQLNLELQQRDFTNEQQENFNLISYMRGLKIKSHENNSKRSNRRRDVR